MQEFKLILTDQDGKVKETVKNDKDETLLLRIEFWQSRNLYLKIVEKAGSDTNIKYDTKTVTATVTVVDMGKGALEATVSYDDEKKQSTYTPASFC